jgi:hypothetical protein
MAVSSNPGDWPTSHAKERPKRLRKPEASAKDAKVERLIGFNFIVQKL